MRESIGGVSLFTIAIVFIVLFTGYICLSVNYSKAYNVKNELVKIIKNQGGICATGGTTLNPSICENFQMLIKDYFQEVNYASKGRCPSGWSGFSRDGVALGENTNNAAFCIQGVEAYTNPELPKAVFYQIRVFYQIDLPIFSQIFNFYIQGEVPRVYEPNECVVKDRPYSWCS